MLGGAEGADLLHPQAKLVLTFLQEGIAKSTILKACILEATN